MTVNAAIDASGRQTMTARLKTDALTITRLTADASKGSLMVTTNTSGAVTPSTFAATDVNNRKTIFAVSQNDPTVLVALQCASDGSLLVKQV